MGDEPVPPLFSSVVTAVSTHLPPQVPLFLADGRTTIGSSGQQPIVSILITRSSVYNIYVSTHLPPQVPLALADSRTTIGSSGQQPIVSIIIFPYYQVY